MAMVTAAFKGMRNVVFSIGKALSGGIASFLLILNEINQLGESDKKRHSTTLKVLLRAKIVTLFVIVSASTLIGFSYHFIWFRRFLTTRFTFWMIKMLGKGVGVQKIASISGLLLVLWMFGGLVGLIAMVLDFAITMLSDDNLETWLKRCALRTDKYLMPHNKSHIYQTPQQQTTAFETEVLKDMFDINKNDSQANNNTNYIIDIDEALALIEQDVDERGFLNG